MPLLDYLQPAQRPDECLSSDQKQLKDKLRDLLYKRLPSESIAEMLATSRELATREVSAVLEQAVLEHPFKTLGAIERAAMIAEVLNLVVGLGPLEDLLEDASITEIMVNGADCIYFERNGQISPSTVVFDDNNQLRMVIDRIVGPLGRRVDEQSPLVSARLKQGHRVNVVIPPLALDGPILTIRKFRKETFTLNELVAIGSLSQEAAELLRWAVLARKNIAVSGGTGGGKTTLLNALSAEIPKSERIITIEDAAELRFATHPHVVRLEARMKNVEGTGEVTIRDLVINSLRMRPDRIVVGECRGAEAIDMLQAMNTGHDGSLTTLHANSPDDVISRLVMMSRYGMELPVGVIEEQIGSALDIIVQIDRFSDGMRRVTKICECRARQNKAVLEPLVSWSAPKNGYVWKTVPSWLDELEYCSHIQADEVERWRSCLQL